MSKKIVWAAVLLTLSCVVLLFGIWTDSNWLSTALALLVFALGGFLLVSLYRADQHEKETRRTLTEDLDRANRDKEEYRKACMEEQAQFFFHLLPWGTDAAFYHQGLCGAPAQRRYRP